MGTKRTWDVLLPPTRKETKKKVANKILIIIKSTIQQGRTRFGTEWFPGRGVTLVRWSESKMTEGIRRI